MAEKKSKSKILVIGATGYIGKFLVEASARDDHPTFALVREASAKNPDNSKIFQSFEELKVTILYGDLHDHESLVRAIKQVDVVISAVNKVADQANIITAIKEAGNVKRFLPSEFGCDVDRVEAVEPAATMFASKASIRRMIESEGVPYTYVVSNGFAGYFLPTLGQPNRTEPPRDEIVILGDGRTKAIFVEEENIAEYTIEAVDDPRTLNKILYMRPQDNIMSFDELVAMWEFKIGKSLKRTYILEEELLNKIRDAPMPHKIMLSIAHSVFVKGAAIGYEIDDSIGVEATHLYPETIYTTVDDYLNQFI
uniref:Eugenol synthase 3 n=1 Tax=Ocimum basilicum TaxID=39350 RepID=A0A7S9C1M1_OCIBA|nr:eugenol synthase 3 [Ocimum basilicum]